MMKRTMQNFIFTFSLLLGLQANAFQGDFSTPRKSVEYLKEYTSVENKDEAKAARLISSKTVFLAKKRKQQIQQLRAILDSLGYHWDFDSIPDSTNYTRLDGTSIFVLVADVALEKQRGDWLISKQTIEKLPAHLAEPKLVTKINDKNSVTSKNKATKSNDVILKKKNKREIPVVRLNLSSPRSLILELSKYTREDNWRPDIAEQVIYHKHLTRREERIDRILKLKRFVDGKGILFDPASIPNDPNYMDTLHLDIHEYVLTPRFAELYLEKIGDRWYLSKETVDKIPELFVQAFPFGSDRLLNYLPNNQSTYLGLMVWQYIAILILVIISFSFHKVLNWIVNYLTIRILFKLGRQKLATTFIKPVVRAFSLMATFAIVAMFLPILQLPVNVSHYLSVAFVGLIPFFGTIGVYNTIDILALYFAKLADKTESTLDDQLIPLFRKIAKTFVIIIGSIYVLSNLNVQLMPLVATLSIGGLAFALAAQDTIKNFFGSLMIFIDKPFQVGQWITASGIDGTVEEVGIRSTRIRTFANSLIYVPNGKLADTTIDNHGLRTYRRYSTQLAVKYETPPETLELFIEGLRRIVLEHPNTWKNNFHVYMNEMNSHSLDIKFYIFFEVPTWALELKARHEIIISVLKLAQKLGVHFAFPTQTLHIQDLPGQPTLTPDYLHPNKIIKEIDTFFGTRDTKSK